MTAHARDDFQWGADAVDTRDKSLPSLKARFLIDRCPDRGRVMEIGSGDGKMLRTIRLHRPELELHGCDIREPQTPPDVYTFHKIESADLPMSDASLDAVLLFDVLEHVPDPRRTLSEAARMLRSGGSLLAFVPVEGETLSFYTLFRAALGKDLYVDTKEHVQAFSHAGLRSLVEEMFDVVEWKYAYHLLGHFMDAAFFAAQRAKSLRNFWWKDNVYYKGEKKAASSGGAGALNKLLKLGNRIAWAESTALEGTNLGAAGVLLHARVRR
jgi:SAM-dependent methyltransferase